MIRHFTAALAALAFAAGTGAQTPTVLDWERLHLRQAWTSFVPVENRADSVRKLQLFGNDLFVQNESSVLTKFDATTGARVWTFSPPLRKRALYPVCVNERLVFFLNSTNLFYIDRATGKVLFETELGSVPSAGPAADSKQVYVPLNANKTVSYRFVELRSQTVERTVPQEASRGPQLGLGFTGFEDLATTGNTAPSVTVLATLRSPFTLPGIDATPSLSIPTHTFPPYTMEGSNSSPSLVMVNNMTTIARLSEIKDRLEPKREWQKNNRFRIGYNLLTVEAAGSVIMPARAGEVYVTGSVIPELKFSLQTDSEVSANLGLHDYMVYVPTADSYLYAYNVREGGRPVWREPTGGEILKTPLVTDDSVFVVGGAAGVRRFDRRTGAAIWPAAGYGRGAAAHVPGDEILAVNSKFVYTADSKGRLNVVDRNRGLNLSSIALGTYDVLLANDQDDRIILAASNGRLICLEDRDIRTPVRIKKDPPKPALPEMILPPEPKAAPEPKDGPAPKSAPKKEVQPKADPEIKKDAMDKKDAEPKMN